MAVGKLVIATRIVQRGSYHKFSILSVVRGAIELWIASRAQGSLYWVSMGDSRWADRGRGT